MAIAALAGEQSAHAEECAAEDAATGAHPLLVLPLISSRSSPPSPPLSSPLLSGFASPIASVFTSPRPTITPLPTLPPEPVSTFASARPTPAIFANLTPLLPKSTAPPFPLGLPLGQEAEVPHSEASAPCTLFPPPPTALPAVRKHVLSMLSPSRKRAAHAFPQVTARPMTLVGVVENLPTRGTAAAATADATIDHMRVPTAPPPPPAHSRLA